MLPAGSHTAAAGAFDAAAAAPARAPAAAAAAAPAAAVYVDAAGAGAAAAAAVAGKDAPSQPSHQASAASSSFAALGPLISSANSRAPPLCTCTMTARIAKTTAIIIANQNHTAAISWCC